ncbi:hypothetical protein CRYUN_Cryun28dG0104100 [Craigia yunnanensis]
MLKFLSKVRIEFNALDPRTASCMEFLAQCNARKAKESNPASQLQVKPRTDDHLPQITVTFLNGVKNDIGFGKISPLNPVVDYHHLDAATSTDKKNNREKSKPVCSLE